MARMHREPQVGVLLVLNVGLQLKVERNGGGVVNVCKRIDGPRGAGGVRKHGTAVGHREICLLAVRVLVERQKIPVVEIAAPCRGQLIDGQGLFCPVRQPRHARCSKHIRCCPRILPGAGGEALAQSSDRGGDWAELHRRRHVGHRRVAARSPGSGLRECIHAVRGGGQGAYHDGPGARAGDLPRGGGRRGTHQKGASLAHKNVSRRPAERACCLRERAPDWFIPGPTMLAENFGSKKIYAHLQCAAGRARLFFFAYGGWAPDGLY